MASSCESDLVVMFAVATGIPLEAYEFSLFVWHFCLWFTRVHTIPSELVGIDSSASRGVFRGGGLGRPPPLDALNFAKKVEKGKKN